MRKKTKTKNKKPLKTVSQYIVPIDGYTYRLITVLSNNEVWIGSTRNFRDMTPTRLYVKGSKYEQNET